MAMNTSNVLIILTILYKEEPALRIKNNSLPVKAQFLIFHWTRTSNVSFLINSKEMRLFRIFSWKTPII